MFRIVKVIRTELILCNCVRTAIDIPIITLHI